MTDISFLLLHSPYGGWGQNAELCDNAPRNQARLATMGRRPKGRLALELVRIAISAELRRLYSTVLSEPIPDRMAELLRQLDQPPEEGQNTDDT